MLAGAEQSVEWVQLRPWALDRSLDSVWREAGLGKGLRWPEITDTQEERIGVMGYGAAENPDGSVELGMTDG